MTIATKKLYTSLISTLYIHKYLCAIYTYDIIYFYIYDTCMMSFMYLYTSLYILYIYIDRKREK